MENKESLTKALKEHVQNYAQLQLIVREKNDMIIQKKTIVRFLFFLIYLIPLTSLISFFI